MSQASLIHKPEEELPYVLQTKDIMRLLQCSRPYALKAIRKAEKNGVFVLWVGNRPRVNRDAFLEFLNGRREKA